MQNFPNLVIFADPLSASCDTYRKISNIRRTKSQDLNASRLIL